MSCWLSYLLLLLIANVCSTNGSKIVKHKIRIRTKNIVCDVDERFVSIALSIGEAKKQWKTIDFSSQKLKTLLKALQPAFFRLGGIAANFLYFTERVRKILLSISNKNANIRVRRSSITDNVIDKPNKVEQTLRSASADCANETEKEPGSQRDKPIMVDKQKVRSFPVEDDNEDKNKLGSQSEPGNDNNTSQDIESPTDNTKQQGSQDQYGQMIDKDKGRNQSQSRLRGEQSVITEFKLNLEEGKKYNESDTEDMQSDLGSGEKREYKNPNEYLWRKSSIVNKRKEKKRKKEPEDDINSNTDSETKVPNKSKTQQGSHNQYVQVIGTEQEENPAGAPQSLPAQKTTPREDSAIMESNKNEISDSDGNLEYKNSSEVLDQSGKLTTIEREKNLSMGLQSLQIQNRILPPKQPNIKKSDTKELYSISCSSKNVEYKVTHDDLSRRFSIARVSKQRKKRKRRKAVNNKKSKKDKHNIDPFWITDYYFDKFADFVTEVGLNLIFDINAFTRNADRSWNSSNAIRILNHVADKGYKVIWELGNEPNRYIKYGKNRVIDGTQAGEDFINLRQILNKNPKYGSILIGPDVTRPKGRGSSTKFLTEFLNKAGSIVDAVTWHQYYVDGRNSDLKDFINSDILELFRQQMLTAIGILRDTNTSKPLWLGETSSAWGGGAPGLSDSYAASFTYLDKLGLSGLYCNQVVMRQSILSGKYALLNNDFSPRPDYWLALLHKNLVGTKVLMVEGGDKNVRIYAHCSKGSTPGGVTMMAMNLHQTETAEITLKGRFRQKIIKQYLMTAPGGDLLSKEVLLNGIQIQMLSDIVIPHLPSQQVKQPLKLPPLSYAFYVIEKVAVKVCMV